jgi:hypothetical protein
MVAVFFAKRLDQGIAALLADFAVAIPLAAIKFFRIMFVAHFSMCIAPDVPVLSRQTAFAVQFTIRAKQFTRSRTS